MPNSVHRSLDVLAVGELNPDLVLAYIKADGPYLGTEQEAGESRLTLGSSTAICTVGLQRLGLSTALVARIGDDDFGAFCRKALEREGVETDYLVTDAHTGTGVTVSLTYPSDRLLATYPGAMVNLTAADIPRAAFARARHLHLSSYFLQRALQAACAEMFTYARERGLTTSLDTGWDPDNAWDLAYLAPLLQQVDYFLPNASELLALSGAGSISEGAEWALGMGVGTVVVKQGSDGASSFGIESGSEHGGFAVTVVDTTGAGDSFNAGYLFGALHGLAARERLRLGNACGALAATVVGGTGGFQDLAHVVRFLESRGEPVDLSAFSKES